MLQRLSLFALPQNLWLGSSRVPHTRSTTWILWEGSPTPLFVLHALAKAHPEHKLLERQFVSNWKKKKNTHRVSVVRIIKIQVRKSWRRGHKRLGREEYSAFLLSAKCALPWYLEAQCFTRRVLYTSGRTPTPPPLSFPKQV